jgi:ATP-binding cassette, subfamily G (WHITE), eye pigment precursor transporter
VTESTSDSYETKHIKEEDKKRIEDILSKYKKSYHVPEVQEDHKLSNKVIQKYSTNWLNEFIIIFIRSTINNLKDYFLQGVRMFQTLFMALLIGLIFLNIKSNQKSIQDRVGVLFFLVLKYYPH